MNRTDYDAFMAALQSARHEIDSGPSVEVEVDGEWHEICEFPAVQEHDYDGSYLDYDWDLIERYPEINDELCDSLARWAEGDAFDRAQQRAESGYAQ